MVYINSDGSLVEQRSNFRPSIVTDFLWGIINTIGLFFSTLLGGKPVPKKDTGAFGSGSGKGGGGGGGPKPPPPRRGPNIHGLPKASCAPRGG
mmetsp:Transcript_12311/g.12398  ORF Transcript_12311/g.12398 Transcript_12311/m.12398 type:complete len:93 (-) Transcript_12311:110-388(-)|eukprot:CAMPEP_0182428988 /NCGR_PEP_ID=MMETSP1167-20130531/25324_1 /TAXON_ID=2988 /ORGANISM="Mallomonas Sp, Strain CCMP3275" /LENGTH=92 /DNA_ID=CAMNT_0024612275 /DNA_START=114 /DNA_END=392 /DNA_ORIENTATION=-